LHSEETVSQAVACCQVIDFGSGSRRQERVEKQRKRTQVADYKFASLDGRSQRVILSHMIGYMESAKDLISAGRQANANEVSRIFDVMEFEKILEIPKRLCCHVKQILKILI